MRVPRWAANSLVKPYLFNFFLTDFKVRSHWVKTGLTSKQFYSNILTMELMRYLIKNIYGLNLRSSQKVMLPVTVLIENLRSWNWNRILMSKPSGSFCFTQSKSVGSFCLRQSKPSGIFWSRSQGHRRGVHVFFLNWRTWPQVRIKACRSNSYRYSVPFTCKLHVRKKKTKS